MSNMVGGTDVIFETGRQGFEVRPILDAVLEVWPDGVMQNADEEEVCPLTEVLPDLGAGTSREFFVYKDLASAVSWDNEGLTQKHGDYMVHFLVREDAARPEILQLTLVIGSATGETVRLITAVYDVLGQMSAGELDDREPARRVDWEADLRAVGYTAGRKQFFEQVGELSKTLFPNLNAGEIACHPHKALQLCEEVRRLVAPVPDYLVMKALLNRSRQRKNGAGTFEPRILWGA